MLTLLNDWRARAARATRLAAGRFARASEGMAAIEMALIFPVMLVIYFGLIDVTNLLAANRRVTLTASTLADLVTQAPSTITKADILGFYNAVEPIMDPFPGADVAINLFGYRNDGGTVKLRWQDDRGGSCGAPSTTGLINLMAEGNDVIVASVCVSYAPITGKVIGSQPFVLNDQMALRPRMSITIECTGC